MCPPPACEDALLGRAESGEEEVRGPSAPGREEKTNACSLSMEVGACLVV